MPSPALSSGGRLARPASLRLAALAASLAFAPALSAATVDFSDVNLSTPPAQSGPGGVFYNGSDSAGGFLSGPVGAQVHFNTAYDTKWGSWDGFAYSTTTDTTTAGWGNQYSAYTTGGNDGAYAVAFPGYTTPATISFAGRVAPVSIDLTNTTYAYLALRDGYYGATAFGGVDGNSPDWFKVVFTSYDVNGVKIDDVEFYLADFRDANNSLDYIVSDWTQVDLTGLGIDVATIELSFASSDTGSFGINTPTYVALDNLTYTSAIPEPATAATLAGMGLLSFAVLRRRRA